MNRFRSMFQSTCVISLFGLGLLSLLGFAGCSSTQVQTSKDPQANLAQYKTYAWAPSSKTPTDQPSASIMDETVQSATDQQLAAKGFQKVAPSDAQLLVAYSAKSSEKVSYGEAPGYWGWGTEQAYVTPEKSLTLRFMNPQNHRTVWQGTATDAVGPAGASQKQVADAVKDIMKKYPVA